MTATQAAAFLSEVVAAAILVMALVNWARSRTAANRDVFLFFLSLVTASTLTLIDPIVEVPQALREIGGALLIAHPYFVIRILHSMRAVHWFAVWPAFVGALSSVLWLLLGVQEESPGLVLVIVIAYIVVTDVYAGYAMLRGALRRSGLSALRMRLGSLGLALVALVMVQIAVAENARSLEDVIDVTITMTVLLTVLVLFLAFASPRWIAGIVLRNAAARFAQQRAMGVVQQRDVDSVLAGLVDWSAKVTGGHRACLARWNPAMGRLVPKDGDIQWLFGRVLGPEESWAWEAKDSHEGVLIDVRDLDADLVEALERDSVTHLYAVPLSLDSSVGGLLIVPLTGEPLFPEGELRLLEMLVQLTDMELGYAFMREQQDSLIAELSVVNEQLLESNKELESFSYTVSHDLRAPLRAINGFISMVLAEEPALSSESARRLDVVKENANKLGGLIDGLLAFSQLGRQNVLRERVHLDTVVRDAVNELLDSLPLDHVIAIRVSSRIPDCSGDAILLKQVFANLVGNAAKFTSSRNDASIDIDLVPSQTPDYVTVRIKDNGIGFDMRYADKIFGVFERVHESREYDGTGIGLALVHRIVSRHGGMIWASGVPGQGASFYVALPAAEEPISQAHDDGTPMAEEAGQVLRSVSYDQGEPL